MSIFCIRSAASAVRGRPLLAAALAGVLALASSEASAQSSGPFAGYDGTWQGSGRVVGTNGNTERIKCRATYKVSPDGAGLAQTLVCASDSYRFDIRSEVISNGRTLTGSWDELTRNATGKVSGRITGGLVDSTVAGTGFSARLSVRMMGRRQIVTIEPKGTNIAKVDITLTR